MESNKTSEAPPTWNEPRWRLIACRRRKGTAGRRIPPRHIHRWHRGPSHPLRAATQCCSPIGRRHEETRLSQTVKTTERNTAPNWKKPENEFQHAAAESKRPFRETPPALPATTAPRVFHSIPSPNVSTVPTKKSAQYDGAEHSTRCRHEQKEGRFGLGFNYLCARHEDSQRPTAATYRCEHEIGCYLLLDVYSGRKMSKIVPR